MAWVEVDQGLIKADDVARVEVLDWHEPRVTITLNDGSQRASRGFAAVDLLWKLKPACLEGKWFKWQPSWVIHNLVGHPVMQLLAFLGLTRLALTVHDRTVPKPRLPTVRSARGHTAQRKFTSARDRDIM